MKAQSLTNPIDPVFNGLPEALITGLAVSRHNRVRVGRGRSMILPDQNSGSVFLISDGWAVSKLRIGTGDTQILDILGPGSFAGLTQMGGGGPSGFAAVALQDVLAYRIDMDRLQALCAQDETCGRWLTAQLSHLAGRAQNHVAAVGQLPARGRLAFAMLRIVDIAEQMGGSAQGKTIRVPMTQEEIGNMLGLTNVSISKLMSAFRKEGLIDYGRNRIVVNDTDALAKICGMTLEPRQAMAPAARSQAFPGRSSHVA